MRLFTRMWRGLEVAPGEMVELRIARLLVCLFSGALLFPGAATAQTTADGVLAIVRGDYQLAAHVLRPLAEDAPQPDPMAQFFMAMLYESGDGVARNKMRACGLY
jgi:TPR repeat protein